MRRLSTVIISGIFLGSPVMAGNITTSTEALSLALSETNLVESDTARVQSIDSALFRNGSVDWNFVLRDGATVYDVEVKQDGSVTVKTESDPDGAAPAFWAELPLPTELATVEDHVERSEAQLIEADDTLVPRDQYIFNYDVCDPPDPGKEARGENGCKREGPLQKWSTILRADIKDTDEWKNRVVIFEDDQMTDISGVRVGGNW